MVTKIEDRIKESDKYIRWLSRKYNVNDEGDGSDLYQEGILSLYRASRNYREGESASFLRYADSYIRDGMQKYIRNNSTIVKYATTHGRRNLFANSSKIDRNNYDVEELKSRYKCSETDIRDFMSMGTVYLDLEEEELVLESEDDILGKMIEEEEWELYRNSFVVLNERELDIINSRLLGVTLKELSERYGISIERVRQLEVGGIKKMEKYVNGL